MLGAERATAEEFYDRLLASVSVLDASARRHARAQEAVPAIAAALGADVAVVQSVLWERLVIASSAPQRMYFQAGASLMHGLGATEVESSGTSAVDALQAARQRMTTAFEPGQRAVLEQRWPDIGYLAELPAPTRGMVQAYTAACLSGLSPARFIAERQRQAREDMLAAQSFRIRNDIPKAIEAAYSSDFHSLEGYLVESALASGDDALLTFSMRRDLVDAAIADLPGLPSEFAQAADIVRRAFCGALNQSDADRLARRFISL